MGESKWQSSEWNAGRTYQIHTLFKVKFYCDAHWIYYKPTYIHTQSAMRTESTTNQHTYINTCCICGILCSRVIPLIMASILSGLWGTLYTVSCRHTHVNISNHFSTPLICTCTSHYKRQFCWSWSAHNTVGNVEIVQKLCRQAHKLPCIIYIHIMTVAEVLELCTIHYTWSTFSSMTVDCPTSRSLWKRFTLSVYNFNLCMYIL